MADAEASTQATSSEGSSGFGKKQVIGILIFILLLVVASLFFFKFVTVGGGSPLAKGNNSSDPKSDTSKDSGKGSSSLFPSNIAGKSQIFSSLANSLHE